MKKSSSIFILFLALGGFRNYHDRNGHYRRSSASGGQISYFCFKSGVACQYFRVHRRCVGTVFDLACFRYKPESHSAFGGADVCRFKCGLRVYGAFQCHAGVSDHSGFMPPGVLFCSACGRRPACPRRPIRKSRNESLFRHHRRLCVRRAFHVLSGGASLP